eukprot:6590946-Prymnesium_polylepis.1
MTAPETERPRNVREREGGANTRHSLRAARAGRREPWAVRVGGARGRRAWPAHAARAGGTRVGDARVGGAAR